MNLKISFGFGSDGANINLVCSYRCSGFANSLLVELTVWWDVGASDGLVEPVAGVGRLGAAGGGVGG